ncbi:NAD(P)-binding protein [Kitasatospora sp. NPDC058406]|uniref:NAD(P)-binding protein n=1 Tax=Streptomycetaceae TaxID=2062 RepID=UPI002E772E48|nr:NAD(P)-binding protein [Streptomyces sp. BE303]MED7952475.1 FAD-dependent oxidoreductase [Streptomyces sp. BE303]
MAQHITVVGGGFGGLTAAISAAEAGAAVTLHEAHGTLGGRARTAQAPYRTNEGPHAFYRRGPHWTWLRQRGLVGPLARIPAAEALRMRYHRDGGLHRLPPVGLTRLARRRGAPVGRTFLGWASEVAGERTARAAANFVAVATFHHDPGLLSAAFVQERLRRSASLLPEARYPVGGWQSVIDRMAARARELGVRIETGARVDDLPVGGGPVIVATSLDSARRLLGDDGLVWHSGRTLLLDLAVRSRRGDAFFVSDLDGPGWVERFTAQDGSLAPAGEELIQAQFPLAPGGRKEDGTARAERLLDLGFPGWRERVVWRRTAVAGGRTGAVDLPGTCWRDRPAVDRGDGVYLVGDQVAAPGVLSEVSFTSALEAVSLAVAQRPASRVSR